jgi:hypothetical protein
MEFHVGDNVRIGVHVGTITDVGTVLIEVRTTEGGLRVVCPWEPNSRSPLTKAPVLLRD